MSAPSSPTNGSIGAVSRHEKSLGLLTTKFVNLLQSSEGGILDLKHVSYSIVSYSVITYNANVES